MPQRTNDLTLHSSLRDLRANFLSTSTQSMPIAGMLFWAIVAVAALRLNPNQLSLLVLFGSGTIFPLGMLIDRLTQRRVTVASAANPVTQMFMQSLGLVALTWPLVILAARHAHDANLIVLGGAILMGIIWIPYGWAADDRSAYSMPSAAACLATSPSFTSLRRTKPPASLAWCCWPTCTACCG